MSKISTTGARHEGLSRETADRRAVPIALLTSAEESKLGLDGGIDLLNYLLVCGLVLLLLGGLAYLMRRFVSGSVRRRAAKRSLRVIDVLPLSGRVKLVVVRCYDRSFLVGLGDKEVRAIAELEVEGPPLEVRSGPARKEALAAKPLRPFGEELARVSPAAKHEVPVGPVPPGWQKGRGVLG